jgi:hypothetical protein
VTPAEHYAAWASTWSGYATKLSVEAQWALTQAFEMAALDEREACAKIADEHPCENEFQCCGWRVADAIRARGNP